MNLFKDKPLKDMEPGDFAENDYYRCLCMPGCWLITDKNSDQMEKVSIPGIEGYIDIDDDDVDKIGKYLAQGE